jgi:hypothetical protein
MCYLCEADVTRTIFNDNSHRNQSNLVQGLKHVRGASAVKGNAMENGL